MTVITIGTRGSALARWQAEHVADRLRTAHGGLQVELRIIKTKGDKILDVPLAKVGGKGLFVKEIEEALTRRDVDLAVHSIKDVPTELVVGLGLAAIPEREDPRDALVSRVGPLRALPPNARVGTSSLRRRCQLLHLRPDLEILDLRGNVDTRLGKLDAGQFDAVVLAAAGLRRLGRVDRVTELLAPGVMLPAVGQGALGIETRLDDREINELVAVLHHEPTARCVRAERALLGTLGGGCQVPVAAHARIDGQVMTLTALIGHPCGTPLLRERGEGAVDDPEALGAAVGARLLAQGADQVLREVYGASGGA
jgi:hydroxymethylbilane synthase